MARRACTRGTADCILWDIDHPVCVVPEGPPPPGEGHERLYRLVTVPEEDVPVQADETAEEFSPAWLGTGPETRVPQRSYVWTFWHGWFVGCAMGALVANLVWMLLT